MNKSLITNLGIGLGLVAILAFLIVQTRAVDFDAHNEIVGALRHLKQIDAEWNVDVLRSKTGLNNNYDAVASPLPVISSLEDTLLTRTGSFWGGQDVGDTRILPLLQESRKVMDQKIEMIEQFKSQNAVLRNSSNYLPTVAREAIASLEKVPASLRSQLTQDINALLISTLSYLTTSDATTENEIRVGLDKLKQVLPQLSGDAAERVSGLAAHVSTVVMRQAVGNSLLADLSALPTAQKIDALADAHAEEHDKLLIAQQRYRVALIIYSGLLLVGLGYAGWRLYNSYRQLNVTNAELNKTYLELKESQVYLIQSEKMSALGQMVAGIAHEINTPLAYVKGTFELLREQVSPLTDLANQSGQMAKMLRIPQAERDRNASHQQFFEFEKIAHEVNDSHIMDMLGQLLGDGIHGIEQISEIVSNLKNFSRLDRARISEFSVEEGLESTLQLANNLLKNRVEIRRKFGDVPKIHGSPSQINQVFLNLITNAVHAMPDEHQGIITLSTSMEDDNTVRVEIMDNGSGIPADVLPKIFDPFFTTKEIGKGTGMGLSISYKIIQEHGGRILVDTEADVGTVFTILLPVKPQESNAENAVLAT